MNKVTFHQFGKVWDDMPISDRRKLIRQIHFYNEEDVEILADGTWRQLSELQYSLASVLFAIWNRKRYLPY